MLILLCSKQKSQLSFFETIVVNLLAINCCKLCWCGRREPMHHHRHDFRQGRPAVDPGRPFNAHPVDAAGFSMSRSI